MLPLYVKVEFRADHKQIGSAWKGINDSPLQPIGQVFLFGVIASC